MSKVVTRFPPSPTGYFHIGSARTALFNYLFAKHEGGTMVLRFEDTDRERSKKEYEDDILEGLAWLGIVFEGAPLKQSERTKLYRTKLADLIGKGYAYEAEESTIDPGKKVVRFRNPNTKITFKDLVRGEVSFDTNELKDFVVARSSNEPLYHLAVVIDDYEMGVTHVIRGEDHISNTARHILILEALGYPRPTYAHMPLILAPDKSKLSKRHGAISVNQYRAAGYLPEALVNYLALLGWNPGDDKEIYTRDELVLAFSLERVHKGGAIFDKEKLAWFNHEHLKRLSDDEWIRAFHELSGRTLEEIQALPVALLRERTQTLKEAEDLLSSNEFLFLSDDITYESSLLTAGAKADATVAANHLKAVARLIAGASDFSEAAIRESIFPYAEREGKSQVLWPFRVALTGQKISPDPFAVAAILGKEKTLARVKRAVKLLEQS